MVNIAKLSSLSLEQKKTKLKALNGKERNFSQTWISKILPIRDELG
jgi:hypothetical protein